MGVIMRKFFLSILLITICGVSFGTENYMLQLDINDFPDDVISLSLSKSTELEIIENKNNSNRFVIDVIAHRFWDRIYNGQKLKEINCKIDQNNLITGRVNVNGETYYLGNNILSNTDKIEKTANVKLHTMFNVVYKIERKYSVPELIVNTYNETSPVIRTGVAAGVTLLSGVILPSTSYSKYQDTDSSRKAEDYRKATMTYFYVSIVPALWTGYEVYNLIASK